MIYSALTGNFGTTAPAHADSRWLWIFSIREYSSNSSRDKMSDPALGRKVTDAAFVNPAGFYKAAILSQKAQQQKTDNP